MNTIGIDIGGTKVKAGIVNQTGHILTMMEEHTNKQNLMNQLFSLIERLLLHEDLLIQAIGIGTAGKVDPREGSIMYATSNLPGWTGTKVKELVEERFQLPVIVDNDANCAAYAEKEAGAAGNLENFICITLGTGVGAGIILNGEVYRGSKGGAGEVGHMIFYPEGRPCNCGKKGCWEQYVSGSALKLDIKEAAFVNQSLLPGEVFQLSMENQPIAIQIVDRFITNLAVGIVSLQNILDLDCFVIGGGVINSSPYWWNHFLTKLKSITQDPPIVRQAMLKNDAGMLGAAFLAKRYTAIQPTI